MPEIRFPRVSPILSPSNVCPNEASSLLTDPKSRKVIIIEHPLLPLHIKEMMAKILFNNLQVVGLISTLFSD